MNNVVYVPTIYAAYIAIHNLIDAHGNRPFTLTEFVKAGEMNDNYFELVKVLDVLATAGDITILDAGMNPRVVYNDIAPANIKDIEKLEAWVKIFEEFNNIYGALKVIVEYIGLVAPVATDTMVTLHGEVRALELEHDKAGGLTGAVKVKRDTLIGAIKRVAGMIKDYPEGVTAERIINLIG